MNAGVGWGGGDHVEGQKASKYLDFLAPVVGEEILPPTKIPKWKIPKQYKEGR